ncbi:hypothetical protein GJ744_009468 [Endocarpon pusillum]|uniref:Uncharacterized protein n=1 Tax=Endocarpon pusillum TaxID=364733 RepID=A0A8H7AJC9_9EURO|nr:hypothetical protein GJ744_009468 [Endocarpon pusillum]
MEANVSDSRESLATMEKLDRIHEQMLATAGEVSSMIITQTRLMAEHHDSRAAEAAEAGIALEKRVAQKEKVEAEVVALTCEKDDLLSAVEALKREKEGLSGQSKRLTREVAKLETALSIRQEEMREMDLRAEKLERRILEGVMDHAKSLNMIRPVAGGGKKSRAAERDRAMSLKRVASTSSTATARTVGTVKDGSTTNSGTGSTLGNAVGMALKKRTPLSSAANSMVSSSRSSGGATVERRILSTSHVTGNRPRDQPATNERALMLAPTANAHNSGLMSLKRSHSVKSTPSSYYGGRKASWNGRGMTDLSIISYADKENEILTEEDDEEDGGSQGEEGSEAGTERRTSFSGTSAMYTDSLTYGTGSTLSRNTSNAGRSVSYASSAAGVIGGVTEESIAEEDNDDDDDDDEEEEEEEDKAAGQQEAPSASMETRDGEGEGEANPDDESAQILALLGPPTSSSVVSATSTSTVSSSLASADNDQDGSSLPSPSPSVADHDHDHEQQQQQQQEQGLTLATTLSDLQPPRPSFAKKADTKDDVATYNGGQQQHSDSGLGSEPQTADVERMGAAAEYFQRDTKF